MGFHIIPITENFAARQPNLAANLQRRLAGDWQFW